MKRRPRQSDLDHCFRRAVCIEFPAIKGVRKRKRRKVVCRSHNTADLQSLAALLRLVPNQEHFQDTMMPPTASFTLFLQGDTTVDVGILDGHALRCPDLWDADPDLEATGLQLRAWLEHRGVQVGESWRTIPAR